MLFLLISLTIGQIHSSIKTNSIKLILLVDNLKLTYVFCKMEMIFNECVACPFDDILRS